jgi:uracil-DNA glycosylase
VTENAAKAPPAHHAAETIAAVLEWWQAAGISHAFIDEPQDWLAPPEPVIPARKAPQPALPAEPEAPPLGGERASWPTDLAAFGAWWMTEPTLSAIASPSRVPPRGAASPELMVLVAMPEAEDADRLLSGPYGRLVSGIARALSIGEDALYFAAALPGHMVLPDWGALQAAGLPAIVQHHVALVRPARLLVLGAGDILPLLGHAPAQASPGVHTLSAGDMTIPALASFAPDALLARWQLRAQLWRALLDWTDGD